MSRSRTCGDLTWTWSGLTKINNLWNGFFRDLFFNDAVALVATPQWLCVCVSSTLCFAVFLVLFPVSFSWLWVGVCLNFPHFFFFFSRVFMDPRGARDAQIFQPVNLPVSSTWWSYGTMSCPVARSRSMSRSQLPEISSLSARQSATYGSQAPL